jgi:hypothetical protein
VGIGETRWPKMHVQGAGRTNDACGPYARHARRPFGVAEGFPVCGASNADAMVGGLTRICRLLAAEATALADLIDEVGQHWP